MIKYGTPIEKGISSAHILKFYERLEACRIPMHSVVICRDNTIVSECYFSPVEKGNLHRMFSVSKSVTALAIGILADKGKISLDDKIVDYFQDKVTQPCHPWLAEMTIRDMLMMRTCHIKSTYNKFDLSSDWVGSFFTTIPTKKPGTVFHYDTSAAHVLAALVERLSGMALWDYIRTELAELGLSSDSYILKDGHGVSMGGTGLVATTDDLVKLGMLISNRGSYNGKQIISADFIDKATSLLTHNAFTGAIPSEKSGYGYMIWHTQTNGYSVYGMGGQYIIVQPQKKLMLITTADTQGLPGSNQVIYNAFYEEILDKIDSNNEIDSKNEIAADEQKCDPNCNEQDYLSRLIEYETNATLLPVSGPNCCNNVQFTVPTFMAKAIPDTSSKCIFTSAQISSANDGEYILTLNTESDKYILPFGISKNVYSVLPKYGYKCCSSGCMLDSNTLYIKTSIIDSIVGSIYFQIHISGDDVSINMKKCEETMLNEFNCDFNGVIYET